MCLLIQEGVERFGHRILAYCFMNNHIHLAIQVGEIPLSRVMQNLSFRCGGMDQMDDMDGMDKYG